MTSLRWMVLTGLALTLAGCGTAWRGTSKETIFGPVYNEAMVIDTIPSGATIKLPTGGTCTAPCTIGADRMTAFTITASKPGCTDIMREIPATLPDGDTYWLSVIDYQTGAAYEHFPSRVTVPLICDGARPVVLEPYDKATVALLKDGYSETNPPTSPAPGRMSDGKPGGGAGAALRVTP